MIYGLNLTFNGPFSRAVAFGDALRRAKSFMQMPATGAPPNPNQLEKSKLVDGWPVGDGTWHGCLLFGDMAGSAPGGVYVLRSKGEGVLELRGRGARLTTDGWVVDAAQLGDGLLYAAWRTTGTEQVREVEVLLPGRTGGGYQPYMTELRRLVPRVLRTLDWSLVNQHTAATHPETAMDAPLQGDLPVALEHQVGLANYLGATLHVNVPVAGGLEDAAYREFLARYLTRLRGLVRAPVLEVGNECWNVDLRSGRWLRERAQYLGTKVPDVLGPMIDVVADVARTVLGKRRAFVGPTHYLYVGGQMSNDWFLDQVLARVSAPVSAGCALYFGPSRTASQGYTAATSVEQVLADSRSQLLGACAEGLRKNVAAAEKHGVTWHHVYECGQSMNVGGGAWRPAALAAQRSTGMGDLYLLMDEVLRGAGVDSACLYSHVTSQEPPASTDPFGVWEKVGQPEAGWLPKSVAAAMLLRRPVT